MSEHSEDFVSFEKALRDLKMQSEELKKLVSEGEIRAFRDGDSMKFRREDVEAITSARSGEDDLAFADALEDDTGMVTEELSDEDTLLAEDDLEDETETAAPARGRAAAATGGARRARAPQEPEQKESGVFLAAAILTSVLMVWGLMVTMSIGAEEPPAASFFTRIWAQN